MLERNPYLINKAFRTYLVATIMASMALSLGVVIDGVFVGNFLGPDALSAVNLTSPLVQLLSAIYALINVGGATLAAVHIGRGKYDEASKIFSTSFIISIIAGAATIAIGTIFIDDIVSFLCSDVTLAPLVKEYASIVLWSSPLYILLPGMCVFVRTDSAPKLATAALVIANVVNLTLDIVFIKYAGMGVGGSALATSLGYCIGLATLLLHLRKKERIFKLRFSGLGYAPAIFAMGAPVALAAGLMTVRLFGMNSIVLHYLGADGVSVMAVCLNVMMIASMFIGGTAQTMQPIGGVLQGSEDYKGMKMVISAATKILLTCLIILVTIMLLFPDNIAQFFGLTGVDLINLAEPAIRIFSVSLPLYGINYMLMIIYQIEGHKKLASVVSSAQALIVVIIALALSPDNSDIIWASFAMGEAIVLIGIIIATFWMHKRQNLTPITLQKIVSTTSNVLDISVKGDGSDMKNMMDELQMFLVSNNIDKAAASRAELCCEELVLNVMEHALNESERHYVDLNVKINEDITITIKDDGPVFDPILYDGKGNGILLVKGICSSLKYSRTMNQNVTIAKVSLVKYDEV